MSNERLHPPKTEKSLERIGGSIRANLLPHRVLEFRRARRAKGQALTAVVLAVVVVAAGVAATTLLRIAAESRLAFATATNIELLAEQRTYSDVASVLAEIDDIGGQLAALLRDDVSTSDLIDAIRGVATDGVLVSSVALDLLRGPGDVDAVGVAGSLDDSGLDHLGTLELTGTAPDQRTIAAFVDRLDDLDGITVPYLVSARASTAGNGVEYTIEATITGDLRTDRFGEAGQ